jgi:hypothetical protein
VDEPALGGLGEVAVVGVSGNSFKIEIDLPVDRFHFKDDRHLADSVKRAVDALLEGRSPGPWAMGLEGCIVRVVPVTEGSQ